MATKTIAVLADAELKDGQMWVHMFLFLGLSKALD